MKFNEKLLQLRKEKGYSQEELAQKLGVSRQAISKWEVSDSYPEMENILEICKLFDVTTDYMLKEDVARDEKSKVGNSSKKYGFMLGTIICVIGLLFSAIGWYETQTMSAVGIGVIIQLGGFVVYQLLKGSNKDDFKFYSFFSLLILPYFSMFLGSYILNLFPRPKASIVYSGASLVLYLFLCSLAIVFAKIITNKK